jgi:hypothetical protein
LTNPTTRHLIPFCRTFSSYHGAPPSSPYEWTETTTQYKIYHPDGSIDYTTPIQASSQRTPIQVTPRQALFITETLNYVCLLDQHMSLMRQRLRLMAAEVTRSKPSFLSLYAEGIDPRKYRILWENTAQVRELIYDLVDIDGQHRTLTSRLHGATTHQHQRTKKPDTNTSTDNKGTEAGPFRERSSATSVFVVRRANVIVTNTCSHTLSGTTRSRNVSTDPNLSMEWSSLRTDTFVRTMPIELQAEWMN